MNSTSFPNKWEFFGEVLHTYGIKSIDKDAKSLMRELKPYMDDLGRMYRLYLMQIEENVIQPFQHFVKVVIIVFLLKNLKIFRMSISK